MKKNLIVYYSYEGNCVEISNAIQEVIDADVLRLVPKKEKTTKSLFRFIWGGIQVYMTKKPELKKYDIDLSKYNNIFIGSPCWFGTYAPPINTFLSENDIKNKNIYLFVCDGGNLRNTWKNYEEALKQNKIVSKIDFVYPIKNGIKEAKTKAKEWALANIKNNLEKTSGEAKYIDISRMSRGEKDNLIIELQDKIFRLERELLIRKSIDDRYIDGLIQSRYNETKKLIDDPVLTLASGKQVKFSSLSSEQLEYLESLGGKEKNIINFKYMFF